MRTTCDKSKRACRRFNDTVRGELRRKKLKQTELAEYLNITQAEVARKLNSDHSWSLEQAFNVIEFLDLTIEEAFE